MESASLALSVPRLQKSYLLRRGTQRLPLTGGARCVRARTRTQAIEGAATDLAPVPITWQITVGALVWCRLRRRTVKSVEVQVWCSETKFMFDAKAVVAFYRGNHGKDSSPVKVSELRKRPWIVYNTCNNSKEICYTTTKLFIRQS
ncbi:hypothetical protein FCM35_KLT07599 [Carex littledalei]|uniref:Uncharacterized protein n=1 Tax=Carex littledalei TaxID=544730 RepID=A0A833QSY4_9POAL|nr:hypothetical protein FCM35_KLT07599 [Carex littledalei]